jgi:acetyltransferase-like isoleucine patch superfamily enzyme
MKGGKYLTMLQQNGTLEFARLALRKAFFALYRNRFKRCGAIITTGEFRITGHRFIEIGRLSAGDRFRMDAIHAYLDGRTFTPALVLGDPVSFGTDVHIACNHRVIIGNHVLGGSHIYITDHDHGVYSGPLPHSRPDEPPAARHLSDGGQVVIEDNVFIGEYVNILKNVTIGCGAIVAAGAVVTRDVPPRTIVAGNPARVVRHFDSARGAWLAP